MPFFSEFTQVFSDGATEPVTVNNAAVLYVYPRESGQGAALMLCNDDQIELVESYATVRDWLAGADRDAVERR